MNLESSKLNADQEENQLAGNDASMESAMAEFEEFKEGQIVQGKVMQVGSEEVVLDINYKSEGIIPLKEFEDIGGNLNVKVGDEVEAIIHKIDGPDGLVVLSKRKADQRQGWTRLRDVMKNGATVKGRIVKEIKGGFFVDLGQGVGAFLPNSQVSFSRRLKPAKTVGLELEFKIIDLDTNKKNVVISHRVIEEEKHLSERKLLMESIELGQIREGKVKNITDFGAFLDLGGADGLLHIKDMSWGRLRHPKDKVKIGDTLKVKVIGLDRENGKISLSLKELLDDPWEKVSFRYPAGEKVKGRVVSLTDYGAFVELEEGVEGLIHVSEMSWTKRVNHPSDVLRVDQEIEAVILDTKIKERKISLGLKQITKDPWLELADRYPVDSKITGKVCNITDFGAFVKIEEGIDGLVRQGDIAWDEVGRKPAELLQIGAEVEAVVLNFDADKRKIALGIKQLTDDPWKQLQRKYPVGKVVTVKVLRSVDVGIFVELEPGVEGFIHSSQLDKEKVMNPEHVVTVGEERQAVISKFDLKGRKISLSIRDYLAQQEKHDLKEYMKKESGFFSLLGDATDGVLQNHSLVSQNKQEKEE